MHYAQNALLDNIRNTKDFDQEGNIDRNQVREDSKRGCK